MSHYSTWRDGRHGWMELLLRFDGHAVRIDSRIDGFVEISRRAAAAAHANALSLNAASATNFALLDQALPMGGAGFGRG